MALRLYLYASVSLAVVNWWINLQSLDFFDPFIFVVYTGPIISVLILITFFTAYVMRTKGGGYKKIILGLSLGWLAIAASLLTYSFL